MQLIDIRKKFVELSGRYDLMDENFGDTGADFFIQAGQRFLDRRANLDSIQYGTTIYRCPPDGYVKCPDCWLVKYVWWVRPEGNLPLKEIRHPVAPSFLLGTKVAGPRFWVPRYTRYVMDLAKVSSASVLAAASAFTDTEQLYQKLSLEVLPHPTQPVDIMIQGRFYSPPLLEDDDYNAWSMKFPETLLKASLYQLEVFYRNTEGANDWFAALQQDLTDAEQLEVLASIERQDVMGL